MSLPELITPIRIYWDLTPLPKDPPDHLKITDDIIDLKTLNLDITATGRVIPPLCFSIIDKCLKARVGVSLTVSPDSLTDSAIDSLVTSPPKELFYEIKNILELENVTPLPVNVAGISFPLSETNWQYIPDIVRFCSNHGFKRLIFPMQRLYKDEIPFHAPVDGLKAISEKLSSFILRPSIRITVHDPFVWRAIFPHTAFPDGRCQAANTMLSIDQIGRVYPCPVMPVPLGSLNEMTLKQIAKGELKKAVRSKLVSIPEECNGCKEAESCKGGCRGRGEKASSSWETPDPACR